MSIMDQLIAIVLFAVLVIVLPTFFNKWSDSRAQVR